MCITINEATLSKTKILSLPLEDGDHFIAYSNSVRNLSDKLNAMILPIPGNTEQGMFYDTTGYKNFLDEIIKKCRLQEDYLGMRSKGMRGLGMKGFDMFVVGQYTVYLTKDLMKVINFLKQQESVDISDSLSEFFAEKYPGWSFAVCLFDSKKTIDAQPIAFRYKPTNPDRIYFPTVDAHDGGAPDLTKSVSTDHTFIYEHTGPMSNEDWQQKFVTLTDNDVPDFLNKRRYRSKTMSGMQKNGDTYIDAVKLKNLDFKNSPDLERIEPKS